VRQLIDLGFHVVVEAGAGAHASFPDHAYKQAGAEIAPSAVAWQADVVLKINAPSSAEIALLHDGSVLVALLSPALEPELLAELAQHGVTALAMDAVPRISRAQSMDVLSSMASIAGYRAVVEAANVFGRFFTGQVTAAGKVPPAKVLVAGAGVAGLAAIATASSLGAVVVATDPRPEVAEQVRSLGGRFLDVDVEQEISTDGYARATSAAYDARAAEVYSEQAREVDIIITTALIPGRPAPKLITADDVASMKPGSVIVDMAAAQGGNVVGTVADQVVHTENGVTILGYTDLPGRLASQASQLFGSNVVNLMKLLTPAKDGVVVLDFDDVVQRSITVTRGGELTWPPPPVQVSAAPGVVTPTASVAATTATSKSPARKYGLVGAAAAVLFVLTAFSPNQLIGNITVFVLAIVIGYYVIGNVHHALHTPLMSVTNAISGIVITGALLQIAHGDTAVTVLSFVAILVASINVFGGFSVTRRMLRMFSQGVK
jgi:NAD(P) transhydrogenase subunit alpha